MSITIINQSPLDNKVYYLEVNASVEQFEAWCFNRVLIQRAMPQLSDDEREFILSGLYPGQWEAYIGPEEEEDQDDKTA